MTSDVVDGLRKARGLIAKGWCQCTFTTLNDEYCIRGAVLAVADGSTLSNELSARLSAAAGVGTNALMVWNDKPGRTQAEVVALFDRAIAMESNHE